MSSHPIIGLHFDKWSDGQRSTVIYVPRPARDILPTKIVARLFGRVEEREVTEIRANAYQVGYRVPAIMTVTMDDRIEVDVGTSPIADGLDFGSAARSPIG